MQLIIAIIGNSIFIFKTSVIATTIYLGETQHQHDLINPPITARFRFNQKLFYINIAILTKKKLSLQDSIKSGILSLLIPHFNLHNIKAKIIQITHHQ